MNPSPSSQGRRPARSPTFPSLDRKDRWIELRTRNPALTDVEINAMSDEEVSAALASPRPHEPSSVLEEKEEVQDPPVTMRRRGKPTSVSDQEEGPTNPSHRRSVRYNEDDRLGHRHGSTSGSERARRAPIPTIESQTKPPTKFKGEEMSFIKVDVFLKKMERYLRAGHGLDLDAEDISDYILDALDDYAYRWFDNIRKPYPYLFSHFDRDFRARYVPLDYEDQLFDEYEAVKQGDRLFSDYLTELRDYEAMLGDVGTRDKYRALKRGLGEYLANAMLIFEGVSYEEFVTAAVRIDPVCRREREEKAEEETGTDSESTPSVTDNGADSDDGDDGDDGGNSDNSDEYDDSTSQSPVEPIEISRPQADRLGLCRYCKEPGHMRRDCPKLESSRRPPIANTISLSLSEFGV